MKRCIKKCGKWLKENKMRCIDCGFYEGDVDCDIDYCRFLDEELLHDVMDDVPEDFVACPFNEHRFDEESEYVQRGRRALEAR